MKQHTRSPHLLLRRCLSGALGQTVTPSDLPSNASEWQEMLHLASIHLVTPQLRWALHEQLLLAAVPPEVVEYLDAFYSLSVERNNKWLEQLAHLIQTLNRFGVRPVLLKGVAAVVGGLYPTVGERIACDIDILVPVSRLEEIVAELAVLGYQSDPHEVFDSQIEHHYPGLSHPDWPFRVELHLQAVHLPYVKLLPREQVFGNAVPLTWRGGECFLPSPTDFIVHNAVHAHLAGKAQHKGALRLSLRQLFEFVLAARAYGDRIDWSAVKSRFDGSGQRSRLRTYVMFAQNFLGFDVPSEINISGWDRLKIKPYLIRLELIRLESAHSAVKWLLAFGDALSTRMKNVQETPSKLKKLLTVGFYKRLWLSTFAALDNVRS